MTRILPGLAWVLACSASCAGPAPDGVQGSDGGFDWYSLPLEVRGLPPGAGFVPVSTPVDFTEVLARLKVAGAVDERTIRLVRASGTREAVQFACSSQPRGKRQLLPGTGSGASFVGEHRPGETPEGLRVAGELAWIARADAEGKARYRLEFGVPQSGRMVQVPFPPQNLRGFDSEGRATPVEEFPRMQIRPQWPLDGVVHLSEDNRDVTSYRIGPTPPVRRPFFYPVLGPEGVGLTELGKPHDPTRSHAHHYSLWVAHASVGGKDFWSEKGGLVTHEQFESMEDGPVFCRLVERNRWVFGDATLLRERRQMTLYAQGDGFRILDLELEFTPSGTEAVELGKTSFGFLAARVAQSMTPFDGGGEIVNARGHRNEQAAHLQRAEWIDQSGPVAPGKWNGIALFDHPGNLNHPTGWHCRNDGWAGAALCMDGPVRIEAGKPLRLRYRVLLHRGDAVRGEVAGRYDEYRSNSTVQWGEARPR